MSTKNLNINLQTLKHFYCLFHLITTIVLISVFLPMSANSAEIYVGPNESYTSIQAGLSAMSSGDTLIIRDGTYRGSSNMFDWDHRPPNGTASEYTVIKAENKGGVFIDGENIRKPLSLEHIDGISYVVFDGIQFGRSIDHVFRLGNSHHVKVLNCSAFDADEGEHLFSSYSSSYILFEDCWGWGHCQYGFHFRISDHCVARRCVMRIDHALPGDPWTAPFFNYESNYVEWQNCITIDSDQLSYLDDNQNGTGGMFGFLMGNNSTVSHDVNYRGCIAINNATQGFIISENDHSVTIENSIFWGQSYRDIIYVKGSTSPQLVVNHCTIGGNETASARGVYCSGFTGATVNNSVVYGLVNGIGLQQIASANNNCLYNNQTNLVSSGGTGNLVQTINPLGSFLKYLVRTESNTSLALDNVSNDGERIGASAVYKIGRSGSLWGEDGYNVQTSESLWPFPNENIMKSQMKSFTYDSGKLTGKRGFCSDGKQLNGVDDITLTSYIWEYLGNQMPAIIYSAPGQPTWP
ncbi:hypothetical protein JCM14469_42940 [Desulfatiferula olefinivorans]